MQWILKFFDILIHLDKYIIYIFQNYGLLSYFIFFLIVFLETGFVLTPFLPGDSLLFALGAFAATGTLNIWLLFLILFFAAVLGDSLNYFIGNKIGPKIFNQNTKFFKKEYLDRTHLFYEKHGAKTIIIARFIPIIRTFAPFVAGIAKMNYLRFLMYNIIGAILWVGLFVLTGFFFGNIPIVKENLSIVLLIIILFSFIPILYEFIKHRMKKN